jgi:hypothetical protein
MTLFSGFGKVGVLSGAGGEAPYVAPATTKLYLPFDKGPIAGGTPGVTRGGFNDASRNAHTITVHGDPTVTTDQKKFGTHSLYFDGVGDYLELPTHDDFDTTTGVDFTLEFWWRGAAVVAAMSGPIFGFGQHALNADEDTIQFGNDASSDVSRMYAIVAPSSAGFYAICDSGSVANDSTWRHYSYNYDHSATTMTIYKDGTLIGTDTSWSAVPTRPAGRTNNMYIGFTYSTGGTAQFIQKAAYMDDLKFINGAILRTGNFTAPSAASGE